MTNWIYGSQEAVDIPDGMVGFVYLITYVDGTYYVGKKLARSLRKLKPTKAQLAKRKNYVRKEMKEIKGWREYEGSSEIKTDSEILSKDILYWCKSSRLMTYKETEVQFKLNVLFDDKSLNNNILGKFYRKTLEREL